MSMEWNTEELQAALSRWEQVQQEWEDNKYEEIKGDVIEELRSVTQNIAQLLDEFNESYYLLLSTIAELES